MITIIPGIQQIVKMDLRTIAYNIPSQDVISSDNISVNVSAVINFQVVDPEKAINNVEDFFEATSQLAQTTLRSILGQHKLDEMLTQRDKLNTGIQKLLMNKQNPGASRLPT